jgi:hypothetical protein
MGFEWTVMIVGTLGQAVAGESFAINILGVLIMWRFVRIRSIRTEGRGGGKGTDEIVVQIMGVGIGGDYPLSACIVRPVYSKSPCEYWQLIWASETSEFAVSTSALDPTCSLTILPGDAHQGTNDDCKSLALLCIQLLMIVVGRLCIPRMGSTLSCHRRSRRPRLLQVLNPLRSVSPCPPESLIIILTSLQSRTTEPPRLLLAHLDRIRSCPSVHRSLLPSHPSRDSKVHYGRREVRSVPPHFSQTRSDYGSDRNVLQASIDVDAYLSSDTHTHDYSHQGYSSRLRTILWQMVEWQDPPRLRLVLVRSRHRFLYV